MTFKKKQDCLTKTILKELLLDKYHLQKSYMYIFLKLFSVTRYFTNSKLLDILN